MSWEKPFKTLVTEKLGQWLAKEWSNQLTSAGNLKLPPFRVIVNWILKAWGEISLETIKRSFNSCALNLATDTSEDTLIHFFKEGEPYKAGKGILQSQLPILAKKNKNVNLFKIDESYIAVAASEFLIVDLSHKEDEDFAIM